MLKTIFFLSVLLLFNSSAEANQFSFEFKKVKFSNLFNLIIKNMDSERAVEFYGCNHQLETNYYVLMENGSKYNFDSDFFCQIGIKGRYGVNPGDIGKIPFKIKKDILQNAERIVFKGISYIPIKNGGFVDYIDTRELTVTYDVANDSTASEVGKEVIKQPVVKDVLNSTFGEDSTNSTGSNFDGVFNNGIEIDPYRLKSKK